MRALIYLESEMTEKLKKDIEFFKEKLYAHVDVFDCYDMAEYCIDIRTYDLVFLEYNFELHKKYHNILWSLKKSDHRMNVFLFGENLTNSGELFTQFEFLNKIEGIDFSLVAQAGRFICVDEELFEQEKVRIELKSKKIEIDTGDGEFKRLNIKKQFDFLTFLYFTRHQDRIVKISSLLDATSEEPERKKDSLVEASISNIRKEFTCIGGSNPIKSFKKIGYMFSMDHDEK